MKSVGEVMAIGRTFKEALMKAVRSLETGKKPGSEVLDPRRMTQRLVTPQPERLNYIRFAFRRGPRRARCRTHTSMDPWFLYQIKEISDATAASRRSSAQYVTGTVTKSQAPRHLRRAHRRPRGLPGHDGIEQVRNLRASPRHSPRL